LMNTTVVVNNSLPLHKVVRTIKRQLAIVLYTVLLQAWRFAPPLLAKSHADSSGFDGPEKHSNKDWHLTFGSRSQNPTQVTLVYSNAIHHFVDCCCAQLISTLTYLVTLHQNLVSFDGLLALAVMIYAVYLLRSSGVDRYIHCLFYDKDTHTNIHQLPEWVSILGRFGFKALRLYCIGLVLFCGDVRIPELLLIQGSLWLGILKRIVKMVTDECKLETAIRPRNERFDHKALYYGGTPSGHMCQIAFGLWLFWYHYGLNYYLTIFSLCQYLVATVYVVSSNRHFLSQTIAGTSLGVIFAIAITKV